MAVIKICKIQGPARALVGQPSIWLVMEFWENILVYSDTYKRPSTSQTKTRQTCVLPAVRHVDVWHISLFFCSSNEQTIILICLGVTLFKSYLNYTNETYQ